uniref:Ig-like domain-containing protein n=1 Tax=Neogobius melanostomus TaxID=47308 RepID=A0A8C6S4X5_9GOBI
MDLFPRALILCLLSSTVWSQAPVVTVEPKVLTVLQGESVSFRCSVSSTARASVVWRKPNNQSLPDNVKIGPDNLLLTIFSARPENHGQYRCVAGTPGAECLTQLSSTSIVGDFLCHYRLYIRLNIIFMICCQSLAIPLHEVDRGLPKGPERGSQSDLFLLVYLVGTVHVNEILR